MKKRLIAASLALFLMSPFAIRAQDLKPPASPLPGWAELEAAGARIGEIRISSGDIFDLSNPKEDKWLFRVANRLHIQTRPSVIERQLLFKPGDLVSVRVFEETERLLRNNRYLYDVHFRVVALHNGVVDVEVITRAGPGRQCRALGRRQHQWPPSARIQPLRHRHLGELRSFERG